MSTDMKLLGLAAKAAGISGKWVTDFNGDYYYQGNTDGIYYDYPDGGSTVWNPLTDDGDALRLAVKLEIDVCQNQSDVLVRYYISDESGRVAKCIRIDAGNNRIEATKISITRAAAEIGRAMP